MKPGEKILEGMKKLTTEARTNAEQLTKAIFAKPLRFNKGYEPPIGKTLDPELEKFLVSVVTEHSEFVLSHLEPSQARMLVRTMEEFCVSGGDTIMKQGDKGDYLYVLKEGNLSFFVDESETETAGPGKVFGEIALLYDCPRVMTVRASTDCLLYRVSQETFRRVQASFILSNDENTRKMLKGTELMRDLPDELINELASFMFHKKFRKGEALFKNGDTLDEIYFLKKGQIIGKDIRVGEVEYENLTVNPGQNFGERAVVLGLPAAGTAEGLTDGVVYVLTKERITRCMRGMDLAEIMQNSLEQKLLQVVPFFNKSDIDRFEIQAMAKKLQAVTLEPGEVLATIGEEVECSLYFISVKSPNGYLETTYPDGSTRKIAQSEVFGFGKHALILLNVEEGNDAAALYGKEHALVNLGTKEEIERARKNIKERNVVIAQTTVKAVGTETLHLRKLLLSDLLEIIHDPLRLGKDYEHNRSYDMTVTKSSLEKKRLLGQGTFGEVWLCKQATRNQPYALKVQYKRDLIDQNQAAGVIRETRIMEKMNHPFVMGLINAQQDPTRLYMVMHLVQGGELRQQMRNDSRACLSEDAARFYAACMLEGLSYMHRRDYVYRDLKGENVLLDKDGYCVIVDLGFAKHVPDKTFTFCGTPIFIAPEVVQNIGHDKSADIWSLGVMIYEMLFGTNPFFDYNDPTIDQPKLFNRIVRGSFQPPVQKASIEAFENVSDDAKDLIERMLVVNPKKRLGCMADADLDIRNHPWFANNIDFHELYSKQIPAPWVPELDDPFDGKNFEAKTARSKSGLQKLMEWEQELFEDFC
eukprot:CAMPEP_0201119968 /NCGR_PEP_ID=MMETSP0850-20130426/4059_1 /ASSEMBLY_ACC=CAM_ASM_000622 /TAXON_ID=183588 /ORGANISM="Pseudo-nitzschia fraudulenta, Strain WWA7" /LENGTH=811 /DNA_ID=CAMNT_0047385893 /DNA_START=115 /DNA_END=2550 /DNA_ORIENTATION=+